MYVVYGVFLTLGAVLFLAGAGMVRRETVYDDQVPGIDVAILGVVLATAAGVLLLLAGRRSVTARRVAVLGSVRETKAKTVRISTPASSVLTVAGEGLTHFHRADCVMAAGREWPALDRTAHERAGRTACGVCRP